jgi:hypothetical protein
MNCLREPIIIYSKIKLKLGFGLGLGSEVGIKVVSNKGRVGVIIEVTLRISIGSVKTISLDQLIRT